MPDTIKINAVVFDIGGYDIEYDCVDKLIRIGNCAFTIGQFVELQKALKELKVPI